ncbi:hypothetical protein LXL04_007885 [Taraxacum kok-saghyz]
MSYFSIAYSVFVVMPKRSTNNLDKIFTDPRIWHMYALKESYVPMKPRKGTIVMANIILEHHDWKWRDFVTCLRKVLFMSIGDDMMSIITLVEKIFSGLDILI